MLYLLKSFATPVVAVLALLVTGLVLTRLVRRKRLHAIGWYSLLVGTLLLYTLSLKPVAERLTYQLESRYPVPPAETLARLDVVVILGGGCYPAGPLHPQAELGEDAYPRLYRGVRYFKKSGASILAFCGGPPRRGAQSEADVMAQMAVELGVPEDETLAETGSHNTMENAVNAAALLPGRGRHIGLVTAATHMPRSKRAFEKAFPDDEIVPIPVHFTHDPVGWGREWFVPSGRPLEKSVTALHEWIGLLWYELRY